MTRIRSPASECNDRQREKLEIYLISRHGGDVTGNVRVGIFHEAQNLYLKKTMWILAKMFNAAACAVGGI